MNFLIKRDISTPCLLSSDPFQNAFWWDSSIPSVMPKVTIVDFMGEVKTEFTVESRTKLLKALIDY
ncbi:MAG: hypothetical protein ACW97A_11300 [Candidatus Thorarchaeota archaeon]|jgi:hypothetical protein